MAEDERANPFLSKSLGTASTQSRQKAQMAAERTKEGQEGQYESWPVSPLTGKPLTRVQIAAAELVPTGQFANVSIGPVQITHFIDIDRTIGEDGYFTPNEKQTMALALNELAEIVEADVVAVQRNLVAQSMQDQIQN